MASHKNVCIGVLASVKSSEVFTCLMNLDVGLTGEKELHDSSSARKCFSKLFFFSVLILR